MPSGYSPHVSSQSSGQGFSYSSSQDTASINYSRIYDDKSFDSTYRPEALHNRVLEVFNQQKQHRDAYEVFYSLSFLFVRLTLRFLSRSPL
jgi:hypothetical protein